MRPLAIAVGDPAGVGPLVCLDAIRSRAGDTPLALFGDAEWLAERAARRGGEASRFVRATPEGLGNLAAGEVALVHVGRWEDACVAARAPTQAGGSAQLAALEAAASAARDGRARALVTGPVSKQAIALSGVAFRGQTEWLAEACGLAADAVTMLFLGTRLRVGLVTTHLAVRDVPEAITRERVERTAAHLGEAVLALGAARARPVVGVASLNPHAGEGGLFGDEDARVVAPAIAAARSAPPYATFGLDLRGPIPAETAFRLAADGSLDAVVAMMHDQATIASKLLDWGDAVNVTWGLPFVRTSVDHGVAYDAAASDRADPRGMLAAIAMAERLSAP